MPKESHNLNLYMDKEDRVFIEKARAFIEPYKISLGRLMMVCLRVCWPTIKSELPKKRTFKLNGEDVTP